MAEQKEPLSSLTCGKELGHKLMFLEILLLAFFSGGEMLQK